MKSAKKTLAILIPGFPENEADTTCLPLQQSFVKTVKELNPGLDIVVLSFQYPYFKRKYSWFDIPVNSFDGRNKGGLAKRVMRQRLYKTLREIHHSTNLLGLLSFWYGECSWVGKKFAGNHNLRHYCWIMGQDARKENKYPRRLQLQANELIALSDFLQDELKKNHDILPRYVIPAAINSSPEKNDKEYNGPDILAVGSLIPLKQYDLFIDIIAAIKKQIPGIRAMLVGDGPGKNKLQSLINKYGLQSNITLTGQLPHPAVLKMMENTKVFLHTSSYEGLPGVCLEALQAGCHVISFCRPMKKEIEQWQIAATPLEMTAKALQLLQNPDTPFKKIRVFKMDDAVRKIIALYNDGD